MGNFELFRYSFLDFLQFDLSNDTNSYLKHLPNLCPDALSSVKELKKVLSFQGPNGRRHLCYPRELSRKLYASRFFKHLPFEISATSIC